MSTVRVPEGVGWTALMTAQARARESRRPEPLVVDPWAEVLVAAASGGGINDEVSQMWSQLQAYFVGRTPFFDEHVRDALERGARQVVLLAAGLDARAARLGLPDDVPVFEVDQAAMVEFKEAVLTERGLTAPHRVPVAADLTGDWGAALRASGFRPDVPTAWLVEGLLMYLDAADADRLLHTIVAQSAPGSGIAVEYFSRLPRDEDLPAVDDIELRQFRAVRELFRSGPDAAPAQWLTRHGLVLGRDTDVATELRRLGRDVPPMFGGDGRPDPMRIRLASGRVA